MSSIGRSVFGAALLLTGVSAVIVASGTSPVAAQALQAGASTAVVASNNAAVANQPLPTGAATATVATNNAAVAAPTQKSSRSGVADKSDPYGGFDPNSTAGVRAFWEAQNPY